MDANQNDFQTASKEEEMIKNKIANLRHWTYFVSDNQEMGFQFLVMTYNILSQVALKNLEYVYKHCNSNYLTEEYRISKIQSEILNSNCDIICLQEVEQHVYDNKIKKFFADHGIQSIFKKRSGDKSDGCALLWRANKFHLVKCLDVEFGGKEHKGLTRDNVGIIAVLRPNHEKYGNTPIFVATTHLLFNPNRGDIKLCQLRFLFAELEKLALKEINEKGRSYHPIILCGDFNLEPFSPLYKFIESGFIDVTNSKSGNLSGQKEAQNKGFPMKKKDLSLHKFGINDSSRFENSERLTNFQETINKNSNRELITSSNNEKLNCNLKPLPLSQRTGIMNTASNNFTLEILEDENMHTQNMISQVVRDQGGNDDLKAKFKETHGVCFTHEFKFVPVYKYHDSELNNMPVTSMCDGFKSVDHIFFNVREKSSHSTYSEGQLILLGSYSLMSAKDVEDIGGLPNAYLGSDHISLIAKFGLRS